MKKCCYLLFAVLLFVLGSATALADMGPKPEINILIKNPPDKTYYLDLLIETDADYDNLDDKRASYDPQKLSLLENYQEDGWYAALAHGTLVPMWGELTGTPVENGIQHQFGYIVPDRFKIIIVTPDNQLIITPVLKCNAFHTNITYDYQTGEIQQASTLTAYLMQFCTTFFPT